MYNWPRSWSILRNWNICSNCSQLDSSFIIMENFWIGVTFSTPAVAYLYCNWYHHNTIQKLKVGFVLSVIFFFLLDIMIWNQSQKRSRVIGPQIMRKKIPLKWQILNFRNFERPHISRRPPPPFPACQIFLVALAVDLLTVERKYNYTSQNSWYINYTMKRDPNKDYESISRDIILYTIK